MKKRFRNRVLSLALSICMLLCAVPTAAFAANDDEQFSLAPGGVYYFDFGGKTLKCGTSNTSQDYNTTELNYIPFVYTGTINAYKITEAAYSVSDEYAEANKYDHSVFIAARNVASWLKWDELASEGLIFGKDVVFGGISYQLRVPSGGSSSSYNSSGNYFYGLPKTNEWDVILDKCNQGLNDNTGGYIKNWDSSAYSACQEGGSNAVTRGGPKGSANVSWWNNGVSKNYYRINLGYRPVLEVLNPATLGKEALKPVTLNLNGGTLDGNSEVKIIVKNGSAFSAPRFNGVVSPADVNVTYYGWQDENGNIYEQGEKVPATVSTLTAVWSRKYNVSVKASGGTLSTDGIYFSSRVNRQVECDTAFGTDIEYKANEGYEFKNVTTTPKVEDIGFGIGHMLLLTKDGNIFSTGENQNGALGRETEEFRDQNLKRVTVKDGGKDVKFKAVSAGNRFSVLLDTEGNVWTAGKNEVGQLGRNENVGISNAVNFTFKKATVKNNGADVKIKAIAAGDDFVLLLSEDGDVYAAGNNIYGQLGRTENYANDPSGVYYSSVFNKVTVKDGKNNVKIKAIAAGSTHSVLLDVTGKIWTAGAKDGDQYGQTGREITSLPNASACTFTRVDVKDGETDVSFTAISAGSFHTLLLDENKQVWSAGLNWGGQLGRDDNYETMSANATFTKIALKENGKNVNIERIAAGNYLTMLLSEDGDLWTCGRNTFKELGRETSDYDCNLKKASVESNSASLKGIYAGFNSTAVVDENGIAHFVGYRLYTSYNIDQFTAITAYTEEMTFEEMQNRIIKYGTEYKVNFKRKEKCNVTFDLGGGSWASGYTAPTYCYKGEALPTIDADKVTREGYTFDGWFVTGTDNIYDFTLPVTEALSLTAKWTEIKYTLTFSPDSNANETHSTTLEKTHNQDIELPGAQFTRKGYNQTGWTMIEGGEKEYGLNGIFSLNTDKTFYPAWEAKGGYTVSYNTIGGTVIPDKTNMKWTDKALESVAAPTKRGYIFAGWKYGNDDVTAATTYGEIANDDTVTSVTLTAQWTEKSDFAVSFDTVGGTAVADKTGVKWTDKVLENVAAPTKRGYIFAGWKYGNDNVTAATTYGEITNDDTVTSITLTAQWTVKSSYTVVFNSNGGTEIPDKTGVKWTDKVLENITAPTRNGYDFVDFMCGNSVVGIATTYADLAENDTVASVEIIAKWEVKSGFSVAFDCDGGTNIAAKTDVKWTDKVLENVATPTKSGWSFNGWYFGNTAVDGNTSYADLAVNDTVSTITLTAHWKDVEPPKGAIRIASNKWREFLSNITFGLFFKDTQNVYIEDVTDNGGNTVKVEYFIADREYTKAELDGVTFTLYNGAFNISPDTKVIVYARLTDSDNNFDYISSNGIVLDGTDPIISGIEEGKTYCERQVVTVTEENLKSVTVNGSDVTLDNNNQFALEPSDAPQEIVVTDMAGRTAHMTVTVNDGHTYEWQSENGEYWKKCKFCQHETAKQPIPVVEIKSADIVCKTQDFVFTFVLPTDCQNPKYEYRFGARGAFGTELTFENGVYNASVKCSEYLDADKLEVIVIAETADGFIFSVDKQIEIASEHRGGTATCTEQAVCEICGEKYGNVDPANHTGASEWKTTETKHEKIWSCCSAVDVANESHEWSDGACKECGYTCKHSGGTATCKNLAVCEFCSEQYGELNADNHVGLAHIKAKAATVKAEGNIEYWHCEECGKYFDDAAATEEIAKADTVIEKLQKTEDDNKETSDKQSPKTGEKAGFMLLAALCFVCSGLAGILTVRKKKSH